MSNSGIAGGCRLRVRRALLVVSTVLSTGMFAPAFAQVAAPAPVRGNIDANGVDLLLGTMNVDGPVLSAGDGTQGLTWQKFARGTGGFGDTMVGTLSVSGSTTYVSFGGVTHAFTTSGTSFISTEGDGSTLSKSGTTYTYTAADGTVAQFTSMYVGAYPYGNIQGNVTSVAKPDGTTFTYNYASARYCAASKPARAGQVCLQRRYAYRIASVSSSARYVLNFYYANDESSFDQDDASASDWTGWGDITSVGIVNSATGASIGSQSFASTSAGLQISDAMGRVTVYRRAPYSGAGAGQIAGIKRPGSSGDDVTVTYDGAGKVQTITTAAGTTTYAYNAGTTTVTDPLGHATTYVFDIGLRRPTSVTTPTGETTTSVYDSYGRLTDVTYPGGNRTHYDIDAHGNVTQTQSFPKQGSAEPVLTTSAGYPCNSDATCNKPQWTKDAKQNQTDYGYDNSTGNLTSVTAPADDSGRRATTTYSYTSVNGVQMPSGSVTCASAVTCSGQADELVASITGYNANGLSTTSTVRSGDSAIVATTTRTYDAAGNVVSIDGPVPGSDDTVGYRYNANRELVGTIGPDPDGSGARQRAAQRNTYDVKGRVTQTEVGIVSDLSDGAWNAFASQQQVTTTFDGVDRPLTRTLTAGGTSYSSTSYGYDHQRLDSVTIAMSGQGPDRTTKYGYDASDRQIKVTSGVGTTDMSDDVTTHYGSNGKVETVADANGNVTSYGYDGHDRVSTVTYPGGSYDQVSYDANGNVTSRRLRDGQTIGYGYDALNRLTSKDRPNSAYWETDQNFGYDLLGRLTRASDSNGRILGFGYDALGRQTSASDNWYSYGNASSQYDAAGRRTRYTWADGFYVSYEYDAAGNMTVIHENGGVALATFGYDDLGRRTNLTRGNGTITGYVVDPVSRLTQLSLYRNASGALEQRYTYVYNPAGQITSRIGDNDAHAWTAAVNADRAYAVNALNQYTSAGGTGFGYDARGNLTQSGGATYGYTVDNQLATAPGANLAYDPLGRLFNINAENGINTTLVYDGARVASEIDQANTGGLLRRYVYGPGMDEPIVWYEGAGTGDRRYLAADERGSIVAVTNDAGNALAINRYDEFGIPQSGNLGRFQYTGQKWLPNLGLYDYKMRTYSPTLGRFLQTDPIGYGDGMNWYNYVGSDPVNMVDPTGLKLKWSCVGFGDGPLSCGWKDDGTRSLQPGDVRGSNGNGNAPTNTNDGGGASPQKVDPPKKSTCDKVADQPGKVVVTFGAGSFVAGLGVSGSVGVFKNVSTGSGGFFYTAGGNLGLEAGVGLQGGVYRSAADLRGLNANINVSAGVSGSANFSTSGRLVGGSLGQSGKLGGSVSLSNTTFFGCYYNGG